MTPEHISALTAIAAIVSNVGTWPIGSILVVIVFGPYFIIFFTSRSMEKRLAAAIRMYENSNKLVERYDKMASEHVDMIRLNTAATVELTQFLRGRVPCYQRIAERRNHDEHTE
jgi:hypothetical protein